MINRIRQEKFDRKRKVVENILTVFGILSIICDSLGIAQILSSENVNGPLYQTILFAEAGVFAVFVVYLLYLRIRGK